MAYFPMFVDLSGKEILVVGGGAVAARRVSALLPFGCRITVLSPELGEKLFILYEEGQIVWVRDSYRKELLMPPGAEDPPFFVLAAVDEQVNRAIVSDCRERKIPVNDAARRERCDFYFPGLIKEGETVVGVTSGGGDHRLAAGLSAVVREFVRGTSEAQASRSGDVPEEHGQLDIVQVEGRNS